MIRTIPIRHIQPAPTELRPSGSFSIRDIRTLFTSDTMVQELHRHTFFYILALSKGTGTHEVDFTPYDVHDYSVFFLRPGQVHQLTLHRGSAGYVVAFTPEFYSSPSNTANQLVRKVSTTNAYQLDASAFEQAFAPCTAMFREYTNKREQYQESIKAQLTVLFIELLRHQQHCSVERANLYQQEQFEKLIELLETHLVTHKHVSHYAALLHLSPYQLNAITKAIAGKTCSELITDYLLLEAKRHLLATSNQVTHIAYLLGYDDVSYFIRFFRKHTGYSPEAFRQNCR